MIFSKVIVYLTEEEVEILDADRFSYENERLLVSKDGEIVLDVEQDRVVKVVPVQ